MVDLPEYLQSGEVARLIPVIADSRKEQRVTSVFLATISAVPQYAQALLATVGQRLGKRSTINTFTEVVFKDQTSKDRPDGLALVSTGRKTWSTLFEAKIGNATINEEQVQRYAQIAKDHGIDAVITISNQFVARPGHNPIDMPKVLSRKVALFHWSWSYVLTEAILLQRKGSIDDPDQAFILREFIRFLSHDSVGVSGFDRMPPEWVPLITQLKSGASLKRNSPEIESVVQAWHQETRDLTLRLSRHLAVDVELRLGRSHAANSEARFKDDCSKLATACELGAQYYIPNAAAYLDLFVGLKTQTVRVGMTIDAPQDRQRPSARINWLLKQLKDSPKEDSYIRMIWSTRSANTLCRLSALQEDPKAIADAAPAPPRAFEVFIVSDDSRKFRGRNTFIDEVERMVPLFYDRLGQHLEKWVPKPPKPVAPADVPVAEETAQESVPHPVRPQVIEQPRLTAPQPGNAHTALIEIPDFLQRPKSTKKAEPSDETSSAEPAWQRPYRW